MKEFFEKAFIGKLIRLGVLVPEIRNELRIIIKKLQELEDSSNDLT